ncbi:MazG-like family protein [Brucella tritici]|uniref:MazG-like family protein n=1 Tax=Brucella tritici TaxID=94626 RepID=UPI003D6D770A
MNMVNLRAANVARDREWNTGSERVSMTFRATELAGEVGEACNVIKKLERERIGLVGSRDTKVHLAEELADIVICTDLVAMDAGIDLDAAIAAKFNATSEKNGLATRLSISKTAMALPIEATPAMVKAALDLVWEESETHDDLVSRLWRAMATVAPDPSSTARELHGPFGHIVGRRDLREDEWSLENDPVNETDAAKGFFSVPLYALTDPFKEIGIDGPANAASPTARELALEEALKPFAEAYGDATKWAVPGAVFDEQSKKYALTAMINSVSFGDFLSAHKAFRALSSPDHADAGKVHEYVQGYEFRADNGGGYTPTDGERTMIEDAIQGFISDAGKVEGDGWRPISSAPKDGTVIDLWSDEYGRLTDCYWGAPMAYEGGETGWVHAHSNEWAESPDEFVCWRPLPTHPSSEVA